LYEFFDLTTKQYVSKDTATKTNPSDFSFVIERVR
jgi:hypothetical protein